MAPRNSLPAEQFSLSWLNWVWAESIVPVYRSEFVLSDILDIQHRIKVKDASPKISNNGRVDSYTIHTEVLGIKLITSKNTVKKSELTIYVKVFPYPLK